MRLNCRNCMYGFLILLFIGIASPAVLAQVQTVDFNAEEINKMDAAQRSIYKQMFGQQVQSLKIKKAEYEKELSDFKKQDEKSIENMARLIETEKEKIEINLLELEQMQSTSDVRTIGFFEAKIMREEKKLESREKHLEVFKATSQQNYEKMAQGVKKKVNDLDNQIATLEEFLAAIQ